MTKLDLMALSLNSLAHITRVMLLMLCSAMQIHAQFDTEFWMPPIWNTGQSGHNTPSELFITTPSPNPVNVHIETADGTTWSFDGTVVSGSPLQVNLTPVLGQTDVPNVVDVTRGLVITSSQAIQCVHKISGQFNQTLVTLKGRNAKGQDFWAGSQVRNMNATYSPNEYHFISVMALEDNTTITFETPFNMFQAGGTLPNPYTITLNARESYLIRGNNPIQHVAGSHITSDKGIVVNSGSSHTRIAGGNAADGGTDQIVPINLMGLEFVVVKGDNTGNFDYAIIVATENNTQVYLDGNATPVATLNAGQVYDYTLTGSMGAPHLLQTNKVAYCYHFTGASQDDEVGMSAIPQVECTGSRYIEFSKFQVNTINQVMNLTVPAEAVSTLTVNGVPYNNVPGAVINNVPGKPGWIAVALPNASLNANNIITSAGFFHAGFLTGNGGATGTYGYLSGFNDAFEFLDPIALLPSTIYTAGSLCARLKPLKSAVR